MIDIHAHYDDDAFDADRDELLKQLFNEKGVNKIINAGCNIETSLFAIQLAEKYENIYATVGFHPSDVDKFNDESFEKMKELIKRKKVVAIGEIGLDYHWVSDNKDLQKSVFRKQLELAIELESTARGDGGFGSTGR